MLPCPLCPYVCPEPQKLLWTYIWKILDNGVTDSLKNSANIDIDACFSLLGKQKIDSIDARQCLKLEKSYYEDIEFFRGKRYMVVSHNIV